MNILALETGGSPSAFAAVKLDRRGAARVLATQTLHEPRRLSSQIIIILDELLRAAKWKISDVDALCCSIGPGSWTGLRIGLSTAKTLAQSCSLPLVGVPLFDALAQKVWRENDDENQPANFLLGCILPSREGEVYGKIFECHPEYLGVVQSEWVGAPQMFADALGAESLSRGLDAPLVLAGAAAQITSILAARGDEHRAVEIAAESLAIEIALAGAALLAAGETADPLQLQPLYLAPSAAERNLFKAR